MPFVLLAAVAAFTLVAPATAQVPAAPQSPPAIEGRWSGTVQLNDGQSLQAVYAFTRGPGGLTGTASSAEQGSTDVTDIRQNGTSVSWTVVLPGLGAFIHQGTLGSEGTLEGTVSLEGVSIGRFSLTRGRT